MFISYTHSGRFARLSNPHSFLYPLPFQFMFVLNFPLLLMDELFLKELEKRLLAQTIILAQAKLLVLMDKDRSFVFFNVGHKLFLVQNFLKFSIFYQCIIDLFSSHESYFIAELTHFMR